MVRVGFGTNDKLTSRLIRWATRSPWSHVWLEYSSGVWGGQWAAHSWADGVVKVPLEQVHSTYPRRVVYECSLDLASGFQWARGHIGADYDYGVIWNGLLLVVHRATGWKWLWEIVARNAAKFSCSEFVAGLLKAAGAEVVKGVEPELTTPGELERLCAGSDDFMVM
jgi:hypothetical protein